MKKIIFTNVNIYDGTINMQLVKNTNIEVNNGVITNIGSFDIDKKAKIIDLKNKYIIPGLINLHSHLPSSGKLAKKKVADKSKLANFVATNPIGKKIGILICKKSLKQSLYSGVTTVRTVGGVGDIDSILKDKISSNKIDGPRLIVANTAIGVKGGHMDGTVAKAIANQEEAIKAVNELIRKKVDIIKLMITGGVLDGNVMGKPAPLRMSYELVKACVDVAHKNNLKVVAHVESEDGIKVAIDAHVDSIEHGANLTKEQINTLKSYNGCLVPTFEPALPFILIDPEIMCYGEIGKVNSQIVMEGMINAAKDCLANDIPLGMGTDAGSALSFHYNFYHELIHFVKYLNVTPSFALYSATLNNAKILGLDKITGSIQINKSADMVVLNDDPIKDLSILANPYMVINKGKVFKNIKIKKDKKSEELLKNII